MNNNNLVTVLILSKFGQAIKFKGIEFLTVLTSKQFHKGEFIKLSKLDKQAASLIYSEDGTKEVLYMTSKGFGARILLSSIRIMGVGGPGVSFAKVGAETGEVFGLIESSDLGKLKIITTKKKIMIGMKEIPIIQRGRAPVQIVKLEDHEKIIDIKYIKE